MIPSAKEQSIAIDVAKSAVIVSLGAASIIPSQRKEITVD
jgi:hypothetical protein